MNIHQLKTWPVHFEAIWSGVKAFELRYDDRHFRIGDVLQLIEWIPSAKYSVDKSGRYTGRSVVAEVTYILNAHEEQPEFVPDNWVIMSLKILTKGKIDV